MSLPAAELARRASQLATASIAAELAAKLVIVPPLPPHSRSPSREGTTGADERSDGDTRLPSEDNDFSSTAEGFSSNAEGTCSDGPGASRRAHALARLRSERHPSSPSDASADAAAKLDGGAATARRALQGWRRKKRALEKLLGAGDPEEKAAAEKELPGVKEGLAAAHSALEALIAERQLLE